MDKNILIIGANSELAQYTIKELKFKDYKIYATTRQINLIDDKIHELQLDVTDEMSFIQLKEKIANIKFDTVINFTGIAIAGAVVELEETALKKQLDVNLFGLLKIIKHIAPNIEEKGKLINVSSMASYGIFPFLSPYCISKSAADILLNSYSIENNVKVVSIRPGAIATKFWDTSIELNQNTLKNSKNFEFEKNFLIKNAQYNSIHALNPIYAAKKIAKIIDTKNPACVYNIGLDSKIVKFTRFIPQHITNFVVRFILNKRIQK